MTTKKEAENSQHIANEKVQRGEIKTEREYITEIHRQNALQRIRGNG